MMSMKIIKNALKEPIYKVCDDCGSEFTFNCYDIQRKTDMGLFGNEMSHRYVVCPVCKHECTFRGVKLEKELNPLETEQCDLSKKVEEEYNEEGGTMNTKRISVTEFITYYSDIDDINYKNKIIVFSEGYSDEEYDAIYDLLHNKWKANKLWRLNKKVVGGFSEADEIYEFDHSLIKRQLILVENCDLDAIGDAYELWEYLDMDYELYLVCPAEEE